MTEYIKKEDAIAIASGFCHPANVAAEIAKLHGIQIGTCKEYKDYPDSCMFLCPAYGRGRKAYFCIVPAPAQEGNQQEGGNASG